MDTGALLAIARDTVAKVPFCFAITAAENGDANARVIQPGKLREDWSVGFMTNRRCRKVLEMERTGRLTLAYEYDPEKAYVTLLGRPIVIDDVARKRAVWGPDSDRWHPGGPGDPNVVIVELIVDRIEVWSGGRDVMPEPKGLSAAVLVREGSDWRYYATSQPSAADRSG
ncbi:MAG TPA: pyridoxamine 5'-phosphate oxidase family protein [Methylomirabilota bacterium]